MSGPLWTYFPLDAFGQPQRSEQLSSQMRRKERTKLRGSTRHPEVGKVISDGDGERGAMPVLLPAHHRPVGCREWVFPVRRSGRPRWLPTLLAGRHRIDESCPPFGMLRSVESMTTDAAPDGAFTGRWRAWQPARRSPSAWAAAQGNPGRTRREDPPPLVADLDCAVRGSNPFLRVCLGSSVMVSPPRRGSARHGPTSLRGGPSARRCGQYGRTAAGGGGRELAIMAVPAADAGWRAVRVPGVAGRWGGISAGGTSDLPDRGV